MNNISKKSAGLLIAVGLLTGAAATVGLQSKAQTATNSTSTSATSSTSGSTTTPDRPHGHAPLGGDGNITAVSGTTITMQEESDEGSTAYTVDAGKATFTNNGAAASISDLKVGDKIFVSGTTSGTNVSATSVSLGHPGRGMGFGRTMNQ
jgi:hypothetical protein